ncbi:hypothetical protein ABPG72_022080 [Tetrahymena utriculariae]
MNQLEEIVKYVIYKCRENNHPVTETLAAFVTQTIYNPKTDRFYLEDKLTASQVDELKATVLQKLSQIDKPNMKTIQMQISYDSAYIESEIQRQERIKNQSIETGKLTDEVVSLEIKNAKDFEGLTVLFKKIFNFLLYKNKELMYDGTNKAGNQDSENQATQFNIEKEVAAGLESVIPRAALGPFVSLNPSEKVTQLVELSNLVIGIRLFNKWIQKGGIGLVPFQDLLEYEGRDLIERIRQEAFEVIENCDNYTIFFQNVGPGKIKISDEQFKQYKDELTFLRQYLSYILSIQEDVDISENSVDSNQTRYLKEIKDLETLLKQKSSAPKEQVYPKFATLAQAYIQLLEEKKLCLTRVKLFELLQEMRKGFKLTLPRNLILTAKNISQDPSNEEQAEIEYSEDSGIERLLPKNTPDFMQTPLDYLGFCLWSIVKRDGLLLPGKPALGVFRYKDKNCVFSDEKSINEFLSDPQQFIQGVINQCRKNPELIHLLRMDDSFKNVNLNIYVSGQEGGHQLSNKLMVDKGIETPLHFVEKRLDPNYCWNEWELRKKALQMANIRKRQTKACQTILSNFKVDSEAQTYLPKDNETNTGKTEWDIRKFAIEQAKKKGIIPGTDRAPYPIHPRNYITGLRDKDTN